MPLFAWRKGEWVVCAVSECGAPLTRVVTRRQRMVKLSLRSPGADDQTTMVFGDSHADAFVYNRSITS